MMDGRFDQHFLELFAKQQDDCDQRVPWLFLSVALASLALGVGALLAA